MSGQKVREYTVTWKYTPPEAQEYSEVVRGEIKVEATDFRGAHVDAKVAVCAAHPDWDRARVETIIAQETPL